MASSEGSDNLQSSRRRSNRLMSPLSKSISSPSTDFSDSPQCTPQKPKKFLNPDSKLLSPQPASITPDKPAPAFSSRACNRGVALSTKDIRKIAQSRSRKQILSLASEFPPPVISNDVRTQKPQKRSKNAPINLPHSYEMLCEFFGGLDSAIRLSTMKRVMSSFLNIGPQVERLTDRRFCHSHLAQLKHILPEAIEIKRVQLFDERSSCMKPDLHITINADAIKSESKNVNLRSLFRARIEDFHQAHPEGEEVPEEDLPEPFGRSKQSPHSNSITALASSPSVTKTFTLPDKHQSSSVSLAVKKSTDEDSQQLPVVSAHVSRSIRKHFSQKFIFKPDNSSLQDTEPSSDKVSSNPASGSSAIKLSSIATNSEDLIHSTVSHPLATPIKGTESIKSKDGSLSKVETLLSTPTRLNSSTPALKPPKRSYMSPDDNSSSLTNKLVRRPPTTRSLKFETPDKNNKFHQVHEMGDNPVDDETLSFLPENLLQSIREKERKAMEDKDPAISLAKKRKQMISSLPKLFNTIHYLFQSINRSVITKEELIHKIVAGHSAIVDRAELEERLELLVELVPEWISEKLASSGDLLVCVNKMSRPEAMRLRLQEAN